MRRPGWILSIIIILVAVNRAGAQDQEIVRRPILLQGQELLTNPGFEESAGNRAAGWMIGTMAGTMPVVWGDYGLNRSKGLLLTPTTESEPASAARTITDFKPGQTIEITAWLKLTDYQGTLVIWARCDSARNSPENRNDAFENSINAGYRLEGSTIWSPVTVRVTPSTDTDYVIVGIMARGSGRVQVDEFHAIVREQSRTPASQSQNGPGLYLAEGLYHVTVSDNTPQLMIRMPIPIIWREQVPLSFRAWTEPSGHIGSVVLKKREHGFHFAEIILGDLKKGEEFHFKWESHVLAGPHIEQHIPGGISLPLNNVPVEAARWLEPTWCCDFRHPDIMQVAREIRESTATADLFIPAMLTRLRTIIQEAEGRVPNLTAVEALTAQGSCTSNANLGAALLRANGIPARIIAGYPTWSGALQTHYVVEYWLPEIGWRVMETSLQKDDRPAYEQIEVAMVLPSDEYEERASARSGAFGGVPYLTLDEYPDVENWAEYGVRIIGDMPGQPNCDHRARLLALFDPKSEDWTEALELLAQRWRVLIRDAVDSPDKVDGLLPSPGLGVTQSLEDLVGYFKPSTAGTIR